MISNLWLLFLAILYEVSGVRIVRVGFEQVSGRAVVRTQLPRPADLPAIVPSRKAVRAA